MDVQHLVIELDNADQLDSMINAVAEFEGHDDIFVLDDYSSLLVIYEGETEKLMGIINNTKIDCSVISIPVLGYKDAS